MSWNIANVCNLQENYLAPKCNCINPPNTIRSISGNMLSPYYCWYSPCLESDTLKSPEIIQGQKDCKVTNCRINISQIKTTGGKITIQNACAKNIISSTTAYNITLEEVPFETQLPVGNLRIMTILLGIVIVTMCYIM